MNLSNSTRILAFLATGCMLTITTAGCLLSTPEQESEPVFGASVTPVNSSSNGDNATDNMMPGSNMMPGDNMMPGGNMMPGNSSTNYCDGAGEPGSDCVCDNSQGFYAPEMEPPDDVPPCVMDGHDCPEGKENVDCGENESCQFMQGQQSCVCSDGYVLVGSDCVELPGDAYECPAEFVDRTNCDCCPNAVSPGTCSGSGGMLTCQCDIGGGTLRSCLPGCETSPSTMTICGEPEGASCVLIDDGDRIAPSCLCPSGYNAVIEPMKPPRCVAE